MVLGLLLTGVVYFGVVFSSRTGVSWVWLAFMVLRTAIGFTIW